MILRRDLHVAGPGMLRSSSTISGLSLAASRRTSTPLPGFGHDVEVLVGAQ